MTSVTSPHRLSAWHQARHQWREARKSTRGWLRESIGNLACRLRGRGAYLTQLNPAEISTVLVCRMNVRLGNTLFMTPLLHYLHERLPQAQIDVVTTCPQGPALLAELPGVRSVIVFPQRAGACLREGHAALRALRAEHYDLVIDPVPLSTGGRLIVSLCRARHRLGFDVRGQWAPLTHAVPVTDAEEHRALQPVSLAARVLGGCATGARLWLPLSAREQQAGADALERALGAAGALGGAPLVGFFAHARGAKQLPRAYWREWWARLHERVPAAVAVEFLPSADAEPMLEVGARVHLPAQRELTAAIGRCQLFVSADTGPMHLASSTKTPTMALFQGSDARLFRPLKFTDRTFEVSATTPRYVADCCARQLTASHPLSGG